MLHTLQPVAFVVRQALEMSCECPQCEGCFPCGNGVMGFAHYLDSNEEVTQGLVCFCSTMCLLRWEPASLLGLRH
jgi:hypothetical protein